MPNYTPKNLSLEMFKECTCDDDIELMKCDGRDEPFRNKCEAMCAGEDMTLCVLLKN